MLSLVRSSVLGWVLATTAVVVMSPPIVGPVAAKRRKKKKRSRSIQREKSLEPKQETELDDDISKTKDLKPATEGTDRLRESGLNGEDKRIAVWIVGWFAKKASGICQISR